MTDIHLSFPSGISVRRYRQQAKASVRSGEFSTYTEALNSIAIAETGLQWDQAISQIRASGNSIDAQKCLQEILEYISAVIGSSVSPDFELAESELKLLQSKMYQAYQDKAGIDDEIAYIGCQAVLHFDSSVKAARNRGIDHPEFATYFQHWLHATKARYGVGDDATQYLMKLFPKPSPSHIPADCKHWLDKPRAKLITRSDILAVMEAHPLLTHFGMGIYFDRNKTLEERNRDFEANRKSLANAENECERACQFLTHVNARKTIDTRSSSYGLKHAVERYMKNLAEVENPYVANGSFIVAALHMGFEMAPSHAGSPNVCFNFSRKSPIFEWLKLKEQNYWMSLKEREKYRALSHELGVDPHLDD